MKKTLIALAILAMMFVPACKHQPITFEWYQADEDIQGKKIDGWKLYGQTPFTSKWRERVNIQYFENQYSYQYTKPYRNDTKYRVSAYSKTYETEYSNIVELKKTNPHEFRNIESSTLIRLTLSFEE
jgi:hypothetical protein